MSRCTQSLSHVAKSVKLSSTEVHENPFSGGSHCIRTDWQRPAHLCGFIRDAEPHSPLPVLTTCFHNKLIPVAEPKSTILLVSKPLNSHENWSLSSTCHPFITVSYVPSHLLPNFPIRYFRLASSPKLCLYFLSHYLNKTSYGTPCASAF